jgi:hypothetical protein
MTKNYKIIKKLHEDNRQIQYKIKIGSKFFRLTRQNIITEDAIYLDSNVKFNKYDNLLNVIENCNPDTQVLLKYIYFSSHMYNINKNHFFNILNYKINKLNNIREQSCADLSPTAHSRCALAQKSGYCIDIITEYILDEHSINDIYELLFKKQVYSMIIQFMYALNLMHINNFYNNEYTEYVYKSTKQKYIKINNLTIPTFGYIFIIKPNIHVIKSLKCQPGSKYLNDFIGYNKLERMDYMRFLCECLLSNIPIIINFIAKIIHLDNDDTIINDSNFNIFEKVKERFKISYEDINFFCKNVDDYNKIINYFYKLI